MHLQCQKCAEGVPKKYEKQGLEHISYREALQILQWHFVIADRGAAIRTAV